MARTAVLIATDTYLDPAFGALGAPAADATALAETLRDPAFGAFDAVHVLLNEPSGAVAERLEQVFDAAASTDTVLVYVTGHGVRDRAGRLYFATTNTRAERLRSTALAASFVHTLMNDGPRQQIVVLDCCYSGAFVIGMTPKGADAGVADAIPAGRGQVVLTATTKVQYAFQDARESGPTSVYTQALVDGIRSGEADLDGNGLITTDEVHHHVARRLRELAQPQQPQRWTFGVGEDIVLARAGNDVPMVLPAARPAKRPRLRMLAAIGSAVALVAGATAWLVTRHDPVLALGAYQVSLHGSAANGAAFDRPGELRVRPDPSNALPYLVCLKVGFPAGDPGPGAIWYGSAPSCFGSDSPGPLVSMRTDGDDVVLTPADHRLTPAQALIQFSVTPAVRSCVYMPDSGQVRLTPSGAELSGSINLRGLDTCGSAAQGTFTAALVGNRVSDDPNSIISVPTTPQPGTAVAPVAGSRYAVASIQDIELTEGNLAWLDRIRQRVTDALIVVDRPHNTFVWAPPDARADLYPLRGTVSGSGDVLTLSAAQDATVGTLTTSVNWTGTLDLSAAAPILEFESSTTSTASREAYRARVVLRGA